MRSWLVTALVVAAACYPEGTEPSLDCTEFVPGRPVPPTIGGSAASQVVMQVAADFVVTASNMAGEVGATCRQIALDLGASAFSDDEDPNMRASKDCALAVAAIRSARGTAKLELTGAISCTPSANERAICDARCPTCAVACDLAARVTSDCYTAAVTVNGATDALKLALERSYGAVRLLRARAALFNSSNRLMAVNQVTDIKAGCIPVVVASSQRAVIEANLSVVLLAALVDAVEGLPDAGP